MEKYWTQNSRSSLLGSCRLSRRTGFKKQWLLLITALLGFAQYTIPPVTMAARVVNQPQIAKVFGHNQWQSILSQTVNRQGDVDFNRLKAQPQPLNQYLEQLNARSPKTHPKLFPTPADSLAYWINAYNALAMRLILDRYPIEFVSQVPTMMQDRRYSFGSKPASLQDIQGEIERLVAVPALGISGGGSGLNSSQVSPASMPSGEENDIPKNASASPVMLPSVYYKALFAIGLYSQDSPPVAQTAYTAGQLKNQLEQQSKRFLGDLRNVRVIYDAYGLEEAGDCAALRLSPWFEQSKVGLMTSWNNRPNSKPLPKVAVFLEVIRPYLSAVDVGYIMVPCRHPVQYFPSNPLLRRIEPATKD